MLKYAKNKQCKIFKSDFSSYKEVSALWNEFVLWSKRRIDILVNNASFVKPMSLENLSEEEWDRTFQVNLKAAFQLSRAAFPIMSKKKNGRIINISSGGWKYGGGKDTIHYSTSKAALEALTIAFAKRVLPVPGGPTKSTPLGIFAPSFKSASGDLKKETISFSDIGRRH